MSESWRPLADFPGYEISDQGQIRNGVGIVEPSRGGWKCKYRYLQRSFNGKRTSCSVARLVLFTFRGKPPTPRHEARHLNGVHDDDRLDNLVWGTKSENERDKRRHGTWWKTGRQKLKPADIERVFDLYADGKLQTEIAAEIGVSQVQVSRILTGKTWALLGTKDRVAEAAKIRRRGRKVLA